MFNKPNEYMYQGKEVDEELGLNWLDFFACMYQNNLPVKVTFNKAGIKIAPSTPPHPPSAPSPQGEGFPPT